MYYIYNNEDIYQMDTKGIQITDINCGKNYYVLVTNMGKTYGWVESPTFQIC